MDALEYDQQMIVLGNMNLPQSYWNVRSSYYH